MKIHRVFQHVGVKLISSSALRSTSFEFEESKPSVGNSKWLVALSVGGTVKAFTAKVV